MEIPTTSNNIKLPPPGLHSAICVGWVDLGTQTETYMGASKSIHKILAMWELVDEFTEDKDGHKFPMLVTQKYTASLDDRSNLRKMIVNWRGQEALNVPLFKFESITKVWAYITININIGKTDPTKKYAQIVGVAKPPDKEKGKGPKTVYHPIVVFDFDKPEWDKFMTVKKWIRTTVAKSAEFKELVRTGKVPHDVLQDLEINPATSATANTDYIPDVKFADDEQLEMSESESASIEDNPFGE